MGRHGGLLQPEERVSGTSASSRRRDAITSAPVQVMLVFPEYTEASRSDDGASRTGPLRCSA